jgi:hypothetical protein
LYSALVKKCHVEEVLLLATWVQKFWIHFTDGKLPETKPEQNVRTSFLSLCQFSMIRYPLCALEMLFIISWFWVSCSYFNTAERAILLLLIGAYVRKHMNYSSNCLKKSVVTFHVPNVACPFRFLLSMFPMSFESSGDINLVMRIVFL